MGRELPCEKYFEQPYCVQNVDNIELFIVAIFSVPDQSVQSFVAFWVTLVRTTVVAEHAHWPAVENHLFGSDQLIESGPTTPEVPNQVEGV